MDKILRSETCRFRLPVISKSLLACAISLALFQSQGLSQGASFQNVKLNEIKKLELCELPPEMVVRIKNLRPEQMIKFKEEFQQTVEDESGEQLIKTIYLRFTDDHIMGFVKTSSLLQTSNAVFNNVQIKVPIQWGCVPGVGHSQQHTAWGFAEMNNFSQVEHCEGWHQMRDGERLIPPPPKVKRKKLLGLF